MEIWQPLAEQTPKNAPAHYTFFDDKPTDGVNYYRLKIQDLDGSFRLSKVAAVDFGNGNLPTMLFPNPTKGVLFLNNSDNISENTVAEITEISGKLVLTTNVGALRNGFNVAHLPSGNYFLRIGKTQVLPFIKSE